MRVCRDESTSVREGDKWRVGMSERVDVCVYLC